MNNDLEDFEKLIADGEVWEDFYEPSNSYEFTDGRNWYNKFGQPLKDPEEYDYLAEGWTPFGDE